jgi:hypothetical protein
MGGATEEVARAEEVVMNLLRYSAYRSQEAFMQSSSRCDEGRGGRGEKGRGGGGGGGRSG